MPCSNSTNSDENPNKESPQKPNFDHVPHPKHFSRKNLINPQAKAN